MSLNNSSKSLYDTCNLDKKLQESQGPSDWTFADPTSRVPCYPQTSPFNFRHIGVPSEYVGKESVIRNQIEPLSRCPSNKWNPSGRCENCKNCDSGIPCGCGHCWGDSDFHLAKCESSALEPEYTRSKKTGKPEGLSIDRFYQTDAVNVLPNSVVGINTRQETKDGYDKISRISKSRERLDRSSMF